MGLIACACAIIGLAFFTVVASNQIFPQGKVIPFFKIKNKLNDNYQI
jgi:hypothetical protein